MAASTEVQGVHQLRRTFRLLSSVWPRKTEGGVIGGFGEHYRILGHIVARTTIANILKRHGIEPVPGRNRKTTWKEFLTRHWDQIVGTDFFTMEVWTCSGLTRFIVLFFMDLSTWRVQIGGIASSANGL